MSDKNYTYAVARIRAMEMTLFSASVIEQLMAVKTYEGCLARELTEEISESMAEKLAALSTDPQLGELAARLAVDRRVAEQEALL